MSASDVVPSTRPRSAADRLVERTGGHPVMVEFYKLASIMVGAIVFAIGLEGFLLPNEFLDGGIVGISIIATYFADIPMGVYIGVLNLPFLLLAWTQIGRRSAVRSAVGIATLSVATTLLHHMHPLTEQSWLALICGGAMIGVGVGVALHHGGALDGTEILATVLATRTKFTVGQIILYLNPAIFAAAGFVISWESALLSGVLFYVVVKDLIDKIAHGDSGARAVRVTTRRYEAVAKAITDHTGLPVVVDKQLKYHGDIDLWEDIWVITFATTRLEEAAIAEEIEEVDPLANITFSDIANLHGPIAEKVGSPSH
jgi:uncharacterized membrane-anchored protein YitT (DUF2179 family)